MSWSVEHFGFQRSDFSARWLRSSANGGYSNHYSFAGSFLFAEQWNERLHLGRRASLVQAGQWLLPLGHSLCNHRYYRFHFSLRIRCDIISGVRATRCYRVEIRRWLRKKCIIIMKGNTIATYCNVGVVFCDCNQVSVGFSWPARGKRVLVLMQNGCSVSSLEWGLARCLRFHFIRW